MEKAINDYKEAFTRQHMDEHLKCLCLAKEYVAKQIGREQSVNNKSVYLQIPNYPGYEGVHPMFDFFILEEAVNTLPKYYRKEKCNLFFRLLNIHWKISW